MNILINVNFNNNSSNLKYCECCDKYKHRAEFKFIFFDRETGFHVEDESEDCLDCVNEQADRYMNGSE